MARNFHRKNISRKKARRVSEVNTSRINKRKYYGVKTEQEQMKEALEYHFTHSSVIDELDDNLVGVESFSDARAESLADNVVQSANLLREGVDQAVEAVREPLSNSFEKGTRKAFDSNGDTLDAPDDVEDEVNNLVNEQRNYVTQLVSDLRDKARNIIQNGLSDDKSKSEVKDELRSEMKDTIDNRTDTISESETVKAAGQGTETTFDHNGVTEVEWVAEIDESTCESGAFRVAYNGRTYTSCRELDGESFDRTGNHPVPVESSHPNCRCVMIANDD